MGLYIETFQETTVMVIQLKLLNFFQTTATSMFHVLGTNPMEKLVTRNVLMEIFTHDVLTVTK